MRLRSAFGATVFVGFEAESARASAFVTSTRASSPRARCYHLYSSSDSRHSTSRATAVRVAMASDFDAQLAGTTLKGEDSGQKQQSGEGEPNPFYRQVVLLALKSAADGVGRYFKPELPVGKGSSFLATARVQALQSQLGPLVDIILSPSPDKENAEAVGNFLDRSQELSGTGATLALALLDMGWSMPAPIRPKLGDRVFAAVFEALRRYGLFTRYGALNPPDARLPIVKKEPQRFDASMLQSPVFKTLEFGTGAASASIGVLIAGFVFFVTASLSGDLRMTYYAFVFMCFLIFEREVLSGVLFNELVNLLRPGLTDIAAVHEAGHVAISYLAGCPVSTYSLGGVASLKHGAKLGSRPSSSIIDPELTIARQSFPEESLLWTGEPSEPSSTESIVRDAMLREKARRTFTLGCDSAGRLREENGPLKGTERADGQVEPAQPEADSEPGRYAMANRFALSAMGGTVGETLINGFGMGGRQDQLDLGYMLKSLWASISVEDIENTRKWAITVGLDVLGDDREAIRLLARNMRETRELGRLFLELEGSLTQSDYSYVENI